MSPVVGELKQKHKNLNNKRIQTTSSFQQQENMNVLILLEYGSDPSDIGWHAHGSDLSSSSEEKTKK